MNSQGESPLHSSLHCKSPFNLALHISFANEFIPFLPTGSTVKLMVMEGDRSWQDQKVQQLYQIALTRRYGTIRHEVMVHLIALKRAGSRDAAWAINDIAKQSPTPILK